MGGFELSFISAAFLSIIGLVVWLVKANMRRQEKVTDRMVGFMEKQLDIQNAIHKVHADSLNNLTAAVNKHTDQLLALTIELKQLKMAWGNPPPARSQQS
jgi:hypothetical protein